MTFFASNIRNDFLETALNSKSRQPKLTRSLSYFLQCINFHHIYNIERNASNWMKRFLNPFCRLRSRLFTISPNCSKIAVECSWNSKVSQNIKNLGFFEKKNIGFASEKNSKFLKNVEGGTFAPKSLCAPNVIVSQNAFYSLPMWFFQVKIRKILKIAEIRQYDKEEEKKVHLCESLPYKNGKVEIMSVVADRLVLWSANIFV